MRTSFHLPLVTSSILLLVFLADCSGGGSSAGINAPGPTLGTSAQAVHADAVLRVRGLGLLSPGLRLPGIGATHRTAFVDVAGVDALHGNATIISDAASGTVTVWAATGRLTAILFDGISAIPSGLATDAAESLYVADQGYGNVIVYPKPYKSVIRTLDDANEKTQGVAVSPTGVVGVTNFLTSAYAPGSVSFYAKNSTSPCANVGDPRWVTFYFDAFDAAGNLFIDGQDKNGATLVGEIAGGCKATSITTLSVGNTISIPGGVQVYDGKILIGDPQNLAVYTYAAPAHGSLGSPTATTKLVGATNPLTFVMMAGGHDLWTADFNSAAPLAGKYTYPGGSFAKSIDDHELPVGVAVNPAPRP